MTTSDYLTQLQQDRDDLVDNLETKGITGLTGDETFTELVPEVLNIPSGGSADDYFFTEIATDDKKYYDLIKKIGPLKITNSTSSIGYMFANFYGLSITFDSLNNTSNVTEMSAMFYNCKYMTDIDLTTFDTSNVTFMSRMFENCKALTNLDLSSFNTSNVTRMGRMFLGMERLTHLDIRNFTFNSVTDSGDMFSYIPANCEIIVKSQTEKDWINTNFPSMTNVKTVAEYEAE